VVAPLAAVGRAVAELPWWWRAALIVMLVYATLAVSVVTTVTLDHLAHRLFGTLRVHATFLWDNALGLVRFLVVTNVVVLLALVWLRAPRPRLGFDEWLLVTGLGSGLLVGLFMTHVFVFYSRYFYLSVALAVLGASRLLAARPPAPAAAFVVAYLAVNLGAGVVLFKVDRTDVREAIAWLKPRVTPDDTVLTFGADLYLNGGRDLCAQSVALLAERGGDTAMRDASGYYWMRRDTTRNPFLTPEELLALVRGRPGKVYFLYTDFYQFRNRLYAATVGRPRVKINNVHALLLYGDVGLALRPDLRGVGIREIDPAKLSRALAAGLPR